MPWQICLFIWAPRSQNCQGFWFSKTCLFSVYFDFSGIRVNWFHLIKFLVFKWVSTSFYYLLPKKSNGYISQSKLGPTSYSLLYSTTLVSKGCCYKVPWLGWLKTAEVRGGMVVGGWREGGIYVCIELIHLGVWQNLTQRCKATMLQLKGPITCAVFSAK